MSNTEAQQVWDDYTIRRLSQEYHNYRLTVPSALLDKENLTDSTTVTFQLHIADSGVAVLELIPEMTVSGTERTLVVDGSGFITIPSAVGAALDAEGRTADWHYIEKNNSYRFRAVTDITIENLVGEWKHIYTEVLDEVEQRLPNGTEQSHFDLYFSRANSEKVPWENGDSIGCTIASVRGEPAIFLTDSLTCIPSRLQTTVRQTNDGGDLRAYVPNNIARAIGVADKKVGVYQSDGSVMVVRSE